VWTLEGWLYLAVVLDLYSRRVIGWSMGPHCREDLTLDALRMAIDARKPAAGLLHHSDRGHYTSARYQSLLASPTEIQKIKISARFALTVTAPAPSGSAFVRESVRLAVRQVC
jgi:putative transposase